MRIIKTCVFSLPIVAGARVVCDSLCGQPLTGKWCRRERQVSPLLWLDGIDFVACIDFRSPTRKTAIFGDGAWAALNAKR